MLLEACNKIYSPRMWVKWPFKDFQFRFVCSDWNSRQALETSPAAAEEGVADWLTHATILTWVGNTRCYLHLTAPSGVLGVTAAREP